MIEEELHLDAVSPILPRSRFGLGLLNNSEIDSMTTFKTVARVGEIPAGEGRAFELDGNMIAVFLIDGESQAIDDFCPHMGASLAAGAVEAGLVICPWHAWCFKLDDGTWVDNPKIKVDVYEVLVEGDEIKVGAVDSSGEKDGGEAEETGENGSE